MIISKKPPYQGTTADAETTRMKINKLLRDYGVSGTQWTEDYKLNKVELSFMVEAEINGQKKDIGIKIIPPLFAAKRRSWNPKRGHNEIIYSPNYAASYRLLFWYLKSKLEAIAYGLTTVEQEFLSQVVVALPNGQQTTIGKALEESVSKGQLALEAKVVERENPVIEVDESAP